MAAETVSACRSMLADLTPLTGDCGRLCGAACCASRPGEETGMLLFPGEESLYQDRPGWRILSAGGTPLLLCPGTCSRAERPLSCRIFPLLPLLRPDGVKAAVDARSRSVCPLARGGLHGMAPAFAEAVRACGRLLAQDPETRPFLEQLTRMQDSLRDLQRAFGGDAHV